MAEEIYIPLYIYNYKNILLFIDCNKKKLFLKVDMKLIY